MSQIPSLLRPIGINHVIDYLGHITPYLQLRFPEAQRFEFSILDALSARMKLSREVLFTHSLDFSAVFIILIVIVLNLKCIVL
jgi:hypothetical protein